MRSENKPEFATKAKNFLNLAQQNRQQKMLRASRRLFRAYFATNQSKIKVNNYKGESNFAKPNLPKPKFANCKNNNNILLLSFAGFAALFGPREEEAIDFEGSIKDTIKRGILHVQMDELDSAETQFYLALKMAQDLRHEDAITFVYDQLANLAFAKGDYMKSERLFKEVLRRLLSINEVNQDDNKVVSISLKLACIYSVWKRDREAQQGFNFCIDKQQVKLDKGEADDDTLALLGMSRDLYGQFLLKRSLLPEALKEFLSSLVICAEISGESHAQCLVLLNSVANVYSSMEEHQRASETARKCVESARRENDEQLDYYLVNLGLILKKAGSMSGAWLACDEGLSLARKTSNDEVINEALYCLKDVKPPK